MITRYFYSDPNYRSRFAAIAATVCALATLSPSVLADYADATAYQAKLGVLDTYERALPLEGGSNFRDLGGYETSDGRTVRRGLLFRSGVMTNLTGKDAEYLANFKFESVVDLRTSDELELFPNRWAKEAGLDYFSYDHRFGDLLASLDSARKQAGDASGMYRAFPHVLKPQLKMYFDQAIDGNAPLVVNCSAGQDRTGVASALMLTALGVPREYIVQDFVLTTQYRRPQVERGDVDVAAAAETNAFAKYIQEHTPKDPNKVAPLFTSEGIPYIYYTFQEIEKDYGTVLNYLEKELDVSPEDIARLKAQYLE